MALLPRVRKPAISASMPPKSVIRSARRLARSLGIRKPRIAYHYDRGWKFEIL